jgi:plastocyanin
MAMNANRTNRVILLLSPAIAALFFVGLLLLNTGPLPYLAFAAGVTQRPDINASHAYQGRTMILGNNVKNLVITIPNEAHEPPGLLPRDLRVANQPYFPQNAVVNVGTTVIWFNGDVGHFHTITLANNISPKKAIYDSGQFNFFAGSKPIKFNDTGTFAYSGPSFNKKAPNYKMNGTLTVVNQASPVFSTNKTSPAASNFDTIIPLMVPVNQQDKLISQFKAQGFGVNSTYVFKSIRGDGLEGCGDSNESLLVLTSSGKSLDQIISVLKQIAPTMPCT